MAALARLPALGRGLAGAAAIALAACGPVQAPPPAASPSAAPPEPVALDAAGLAAADLARGEQLSLACQACHALEASRPSPIGPNLAGVFGRRAGSAAGFEYSSALAGSTFVWSVDLLDAWLEDPTGFLPGTTMAFTGYQSARDRRDLIAYLLRATDGRPADPATGSAVGPNPSPDLRPEEAPVAALARD